MQLAVLRLQEQPLLADNRLQGLYLRCEAVYDLRVYQLLLLLYHNGLFLHLHVLMR